MFRPPPIDELDATGGAAFTTGAGALSVSVDVSMRLSCGCSKTTPASTGAAASTAAMATPARKGNGLTWTASSCRSTREIDACARRTLRLLTGGALSLFDRPHFARRQPRVDEAIRRVEGIFSQNAFVRSRAFVCPSTHRQSLSSSIRTMTIYRVVGVRHLWGYKGNQVRPTQQHIAKTHCNDCRSTSGEYTTLIILDSVGRHIF